MITTIAIDDEPLAFQLVTGYIEKTPGLKLTGKFDNPLDALIFLSEKQLILFLLIFRCPIFQVLSLHRLWKKAKGIFTTAYEKYALEGYKLEIVDYLLKPFSYEEFLVAVQKAQKLIKLEQKAPVNVEANNEFLFLKSDYKIKRINFKIFCILKGLKDYVKVYTQNNPQNLFFHLHP